MSHLKRATVLMLAVLLGAGLAWAGAPKAYQVTGPILELTDDMIVVQKGQEKWQIARDASTKVTGELKVGTKVTIEYRMTATSIEVKTAAAPKKAAAKTP
jgi:hypothetical protein